jgi:hypothetical protein
VWGKQTAALGLAAPSPEAPRDLRRLLGTAAVKALSGSRTSPAGDVICESSKDACVRFTLCKEIALAKCPLEPSYRSVVPLEPLSSENIVCIDMFEMTIFAPCIEAKQVRSPVADSCPDR